MSTELETTPFADDTVRRAYILLSEAFALYESTHNVAAAFKYEQVAKAAQVIGRDDIEATARFWQGACLHSAGRLSQALAALAPIASGRLQPANCDRPVHMGITRYVLIAVDIPLDLDVLERAIREAERLECHTGRQRRARLLLVRARLAASRGDDEEAVRFSMEGVERAAVESDGFARGAYYKEAMRACLRLGDVAMARRLSDNLLQVDDAFVVSRRIIAAAHRSIADRLEGNIAGALAEARSAVELARNADDVHDRLYSADAFIRALLLSPQIGEARAALNRLIRERRSEAGALRYDVRLLIADLHLALARHAGGLTALDPESGRTFPDEPAHTDLDLATRQLRRTRTALAAAGRLGAFLDRRLHCLARAPRIAARLSLVAATARELA